jgi:predicted ribonuclease YlaK
MEYTGYKELQLTDEQFSQIYTDGILDGYDFLENEYLIAKNSDGDIVDKFIYQNGLLEQVHYQTLKNEYLGVIKPRNPQQHLVIDTLLDPTSKIKVIKGVYGSGKDYLMLAAAL